MGIYPKINATSDRTILVIEDSVTIRNFLRRVFEEEMPGIHVVEAADGKAAIHEMTRCKADLIVTDLQMPGMDGRSFIAMLRSNPTLVKKKVLVLSSEPMDDLLYRHGLDPGIRFLNKPSAIPEIINAARALLGGWHPSPSL